MYNYVGENKDNFDLLEQRLTSVIRACTRLVIGLTVPCFFILGRSVDSWQLSVFSILVLLTVAGLTFVSSRKPETPSYAAVP